MQNALERRLFYIPSFKIYGGCAGFFDYGPTGCALKSNFLAAWRQHFVVEENMMEIECPAVTPEVVLKTSGHVDRFQDFMVSDTITKEPYRADHVLEEKLEALLEATGADALTGERREEVARDLAAVEGMDKVELGAKLAAYNCTSPEGNPLTEPFPFNLMFKTSIGPRGDATGYLRPETAQGIFINFKDLLFYNGNKLPFAAAQIGMSYRNEISPQKGLIRVREFQQAEIEHFCSPFDKSHPKFIHVDHVEVPLYSATIQMKPAAKDRVPVVMKMGDAVSSKIVANETIGYFIARTFQFLLDVGVDPNRVRFRQHLAHEMAHYANDCWDAEIETSYGWIECAGLADRSAYDLTVHGKATKTDLTAYESFAMPQTVEEVQITPNKRTLGQAFKRDAKLVMDALTSLSEADAEALQTKLSAEGQGDVVVQGNPVTVTADHVSIVRATVTKHGRTFIPSVIEPSFGVGRIIYALLEHAFYVREASKEDATDEKDKDKDASQRTVFRFSPMVAPVKCTIFPLMQKPELIQPATELIAQARRAGLSSIMDTTGVSIGRRYASTDEIGVPYAVTIDYDTLKDGTVTIRERDSMGQVRVPLTEVIGVLTQLSGGIVTWEATQIKYPAQKATSE